MKGIGKEKFRSRKPLAHLLYHFYPCETTSLLSVNRNDRDRYGCSFENRRDDASAEKMVECAMPMGAENNHVGMSRDGGLKDFIGRYRH